MSDERIVSAFGYNNPPPECDVVDVELWYPRSAPNCHTIQIGLCDTRAADGIRVTYDFDRDGWAIWQEGGIEYDGYREPNGQWVEVAFIKAWQLTRPATDAEKFPAA